MTIQSVLRRNNTAKLSFLSSFFVTALMAALFVAMLACPLHAQAGPVSYSSLKEGQVIHGFKAVAIYLNDADKPMGARFVHGTTGLTLDLLGDPIGAAGHDRRKYLSRL